MFDFIKEIDNVLYNHFDDINKSIQLRTHSVETHLHIYAERLIKIINNREQIIIKQKIQLGELLENAKFCKILKTKYKINDDFLLNIKKISNKSNAHKHNDRSAFEEKELKKMYRLLMYTTANIYTTITNKRIELSNIDVFFDNLLQGNLELEKKIREQIRRDFEENNKDKEQQLEETNLKIKIQEQELENMKSKLAEYNETKDKITELEIKNSEVNNLVDTLREKIALLETKINDASDSKIIEEKKNILKELEEKEKILVENNILIEEYRNKSIENPTIEIDSREKLIEELKEKIRTLENSNFIENQNKDSELLELRRKLDRKILFDNSYVENDDQFILRNIVHNNYSTSKYKQFYAVINNLLQRGNQVNSSDYINKHNLDIKTKKEIIRLQMLILNLIKNDRLKDNIWRLNYINGNIETLEIAIYDIFEYIEKLTSLAKIEFVRPKIIMTNTPYDNSGLSLNIEYSYNYDIDMKNIFYIEDIELIENSDDGIDSSKIESMNYWIEDTIVYNIKEKDRKTLEWFLQNIFGYESFRTGQFEIISHTLKGENTIGILPTGSGKSIVYQLASLLQPKITIIVAPTTELINDQIRVLKNRFKITKTIQITKNIKDKKKALNDLGNCKSIFTFIAPERLQSSEFKSKLLLLQNNNAFDKIILDEVHCLSEWGHDFRIPYLMVAHTLKQYCKNVKFLGLTATASKNVIKDLMVELNIKKRQDIVYNESYKRENLSFQIDYFNNQNQMDTSLIKTIYDTNVTLNGNKTNAVVIFAKRKDTIDELTEKLASDDLFGNKVSKYYSQKNEQLSTEEFINNEKSILVCTKAFGMGIDKPNIRSTIHYGIPSSLEAFYQEAGRAGREVGSRAVCKILSYKYTQEQEKLIEEFLNPRTSISRLKEIGKNKTINYVTDIGTNFYFLTKDLSEPLEEAKATRDFYAKIYKTINKNNSCKFLKKEEDKLKCEKYLYILHKCGIVNNWEVSYLGDIIEFKVIFDSKYKDIEYIKKEAQKYIKQYPTENKETLNKIENIKDYHGINEIFVELRKWYHTNFIEAKRNQLANIYKYTTSDFCNRNCSDEIQEKIDSYFNISNLLCKTEDGFYYGFEKNTIEEVIEQLIAIKNNELTSAITNIESELESVENNKMKLYISLLHLRNNDFETRNGRNQFEDAIENISLEEKVTIYRYLASGFYNILTEEQKEILLDIMYEKDRRLFRGVLLENIKDDAISKKYWIPFINERMNKLFGGSNE